MGSFFYIPLIFLPNIHLSEALTFRLKTHIFTIFCYLFLLLNLISYL